MTHRKMSHDRRSDSPPRDVTLPAPDLERIRVEPRRVVVERMEPQIAGGRSERMAHVLLIRA